MPITFTALVSTISHAWRGYKATSAWLTDGALKADFEQYLAKLEHRRVLYASWEYENTHAVLASLSEILNLTRDFRATHNKRPEIRKLFGDLITALQRTLDTIHGCNTHSRQGEYMAYRALLRFRGELAKTLALICGSLQVNPHGTELEQFIMNMALVKPTA